MFAIKGYFDAGKTAIQKHLKKTYYARIIAIEKSNKKYCVADTTAINTLLVEGIGHAEMTAK